MLRRIFTATLATTAIALSLSLPAVAAKDTTQEFLREYRTSVSHYEYGSLSTMKDAAPRQLLGEGYRSCFLLDQGNSQFQVMEEYVNREYSGFDPGTPAVRHGWLYAAHVTDAAIMKICPEHRDGISGVQLLPWNDDRN
jgi:hypothetical protein